MGRVSEPEVPRAASSTCAKRAKSAKTPPPPHFGMPAVSQDRLERVNVAAGGQAIVGAVTHPRYGGYPETQDQPYGTEHERAQEPAVDTPVRSKEAGRLALPEAESQGPEPVQAAHLAAARPEVKPTGATAMACSRQRPLKRGSPCQRSWAGASSNAEALPRLHNGSQRGDKHSFQIGRQ